MRVAMGQYQARRGKVDANLERMDGVITSSGADLVVFPELFLTGYMARDDHIRLGETLDGDAVAQVAAAAKASGATVVFGMPESDPVKRGITYNSSVVVRPDGTADSYRKWSLPNFGPFEERMFFGHGNNLPVFDTPVGRLGLLICYDIFFPEVCKAYALQGADILVCISASPTTSRDFFVKLAMARAIENACAFIYCNQVGSQMQLTFWGGSHIVGPRGQYIVEGPPYEEATVEGDIDLKEIELSRPLRPTARDTRKEAFALMHDML
ncbi:MAG: carbon-nitrogen hydrolase family protein [Candidatus Thermoplasmatota archaeon]|nr:carbon-nitrogen hydrolase family protein [Candidatus Thermoplasmatota archaeon]